MMSDFILCQWSAWAPGFSARDDRLMELGNSVVPECVPKMLRRRLTPLARAVFNVADQCINGEKTFPVVFSSAHGEICKSLTMLQTIQAGHELSPTAFSLSVHNAIAGLFSIAYRNTQEITVIAPGQEGIAPAFIEALGMLHEGADEVLIILYDEPIADFYPISPFNLNSPNPCVLALRIALVGDGLPLQFDRCTQSREDGEHPVQLQLFLKFLLAKERSLSLGNQEHSWIWHKK
ncbi:beta-ketoacyl synthase chain length factor [Methylobacter psychrophilus]|uniref:beta-ketoacyl synthase chain length factor n=1 Tax=Methylobacter psychrophilus TaxID=96941 RepID=UPI0021D49477|nr:beta-ketoacyl synthase chain length factor [Methylobacter psychrophilus]